MMAQRLFACPHSVRVRAGRELQETDLAQALSLLAENPLRGVHLRTFLEDNGVAHPANRGRFYGYFEEEELVGIALLGHTTMIYTRPAAESQALAFFAEEMRQQEVQARVIFGPRTQVERFGSHLAQAGQAPKMVRDFHWYVCQKPRRSVETLQLQRAYLDELNVISEAQARQLLEETGTDPRKADPAGFEQRVAARIERGRTWIKLEADEVIFKTELQSVTPEVVYLEGVWTREDRRGQGVAKQCLTELVHRLLRQHQYCCLAVEAEAAATQHLYEEVGFDYVEDYQACYLK